MKRIVYVKDLKGQKIFDINVESLYDHNHSEIILKNGRIFLIDKLYHIKKGSIRDIINSKIINIEYNIYTYTCGCCYRGDLTITVDNGKSVLFHISPSSRGGKGLISEVNVSVIKKTAKSINEEIQHYSKLLKKSRNNLKDWKIRKAEILLNLRKWQKVNVINEPENVYIFSPRIKLSDDNCKEFEEEYLKGIISSLSEEDYLHVGYKL